MCECVCVCVHENCLHPVKREYHRTLVVPTTIKCVIRLVSEDMMFIEQNLGFVVSL